MSDTLEIAIQVIDPQVREQLIARLSVDDYDAFEERDDHLVCFIKAPMYDPAIIENILADYNLSYTKAIIRDQNWNAVWESNFNPVVVDDFCVIRADFHTPFANIQNEILITPKMSFGTGHHATTYMMISEMQNLDFTYKIAADFGTGTGVLAILAEKLGSKQIWAIDLDDWSIENATENIEKNRCSKITLEKKDSFITKQKFDVIMANINKNVILSNKVALSEAVLPNGCLLISGLLQEDEKDIIAAFTSVGFSYLRTVERNKWICLLFQQAAQI